MIDTATNTITRTYTVGDGAAAVAVSPDGNTVYISHRTDNTVWVIDFTFS